MRQEEDLHFLLNDSFDQKTTVRRKGESLLFSLFFHFLLILLIIFSPSLHWPWQKAPALPSIRDITRLEANRPVFMPLPEDHQKIKKIPNPPDNDRMSADKTPMVTPPRQKSPASEVDTKAQEPPIVKGTSPPAPPPVETAQAPPSATNQEQAGLTKEDGKMLGKLSLPEEMNREGKHGTNLRDLMAKMETPGNSIESSIDDAIRRGLFRGGSGIGDVGGGMRKFDNRQANFSVDEPTILSDTRGVDFGAWLRIVYFRVRDNWYAAIPQLIRTGTRGKTVLVFDVLKDGRILNLQLAKTSGVQPYDRAAISSINLSVPFPNFPPAFDGDHLTIQFSYFYNIQL